MSSIEDLLRRATATIEKQAATIRELRGEDTIAKAISDSLSVPIEDQQLQHPAAAGAELIARGVRGDGYVEGNLGTFTKREDGGREFRKATEKVSAQHVGGFGGENLGDRENVKKLRAEKDARGNPYNLN